MLHVVDASSGEEVPRDVDGCFVVWDQRDYLVQGEALQAHPPVLRLQHLGGVGVLCFDNYVGLAEIAGQRFRVRHGKLTETAFDRMLDGVVHDLADLAFDFGSPTAVAFSRDATAHDSVAYHALAYLRQVMRRADDGERMLGQFLVIARNPHRRMDRQPCWVPSALASAVTSAGLTAVVSHPERLMPLASSSPLLDTGLASRLARNLFPESVLSERRVESVDTHENRLVKRVLRLALELVCSFEQKKLVNSALRADVTSMREELEWMLGFEFLDEVEELSIVPFQSSTMQRREGYRDFLQHYIQLGMASALAGDRDLWERLLDLKDSALLYEVWTFFEVKRVLDKMLGEPKAGQLSTHDDQRRIVPWSARLQYGQCEVVYNRTYNKKSGSYSVTLRPDIVVRRATPSGCSSLILDAKLKFEGARLADIENEDPDDWSRTVTRADMYKMHTYRDAIREAVGAFVLYPGSTFAMYPAVDNATVEGVGAIPLVPGGESTRLASVLGAFLGLPLS